MATEIVTFWPRGTKPVDLKCVCVFCFVLFCFLLKLVSTCDETWEPVWPPIGSLYTSSICSYFRLLESPFGKVIRKFAEVFRDYLKISEDHSRFHEDFRRIVSFLQT